jgi:predicted DNA-binding transcriptional regulator YafY
MLEAIRERRVARIGYVEPTTGERTEREVEPLGFVCRGDAWWLVAWCRLRADARAFRVDHVSTFHGDGAVYEPREGFSFAEIVARDRHLAARLFGY